MNYEERLAATVARMPFRTKETIDNYVTKRWKPGHFVGAVLANDLKGAVAAADRDNQAALIEIVRYVYNYLPHTCWGSYEIVNAWLYQKQEEANI